jgi:hypothetical protein
VHDCAVVPLSEPHGVELAHDGDGPQEMPPLPLLAPLLLLLLPHAADSPSCTQTGWPEG